MGLSQCLLCPFIQMDPAFMQARQEISPGVAHSRCFPHNTEMLDSSYAKT